MKKLSPIEWQAFSQKKQIEKITHNLESNVSFQLSAVAEVVLVIFGTALSSVFDEKASTIWYTILALSVIVLLISFVKPFCRWIQKMKTGNDLLSSREFIDSFDNDICYYVMMAESYYSMLLDKTRNVSEDKATSQIDEKIESQTNDKKIDISVLQFYFIETSYYLNKAIMCLQPIYNMSDKVIGQDFSEIVSKRMIAITRYKNVCNLIQSIYASLNQSSALLSDMPDKDLIISTNNHYFECLNTIVNLSNHNLKQNK